MTKAVRFTVTYVYRYELFLFLQHREEQSAPQSLTRCVVAAHQRLRRCSVSGAKAVAPNLLWQAL